MGVRVATDTEPDQSSEREYPMQTRQISLAMIDISQFSTRKDLSAGGEDSSLDDLARSVAEQGLLNPPTLRKTAVDRYEVIAGQRRILAVQKLGWREVSAIVRDDLTDTQAVAISLIENVQRAEMSPMDKARAYAVLKDQHGSIAAVSKQTAVGQSTIRKYLGLLALSPALQRRVGTGSGPAGIGLMAQVAANFTTPEEQERAYDRVKGFNSDVAQTILKRTHGDIGNLDPLVDLAVEGEFNKQMCGTSLETCPHVPENLRSAIRELVSRSHSGEF
jgi:ParB/RepB/Spo0J family partition protein